MKSYRQALEEKVLDVIRAGGSSGVRSIDLRKRLPARGRGVSASDLQLALRHLRRDGLVQSEGIKRCARNFAVGWEGTPPAVAEGPSLEERRRERLAAADKRRAADRAVLSVIRGAGEAGARTLDVALALRDRGIRGCDLYNALRRLRKAGQVRTEGGRKGARNFAIDASE